MKSSQVTPSGMAKDIAEGPSTTNRSHASSVDATCLISPPRQSALTVGFCPACSSVRPRTVLISMLRASASSASRSARSASRVVGVVVVPVIVIGSFRS